MNEMIQAALMKRLQGMGGAAISEKEMNRAQGAMDPMAMHGGAAVSDMEAAAMDESHPVALAQARERLKESLKRLRMNEFRGEQDAMYQQRMSDIEKEAMSLDKPQKKSSGY